MSTQVSLPGLRNVFLIEIQDTPKDHSVSRYNHLSDKTDFYRSFLIVRQNGFKDPPFLIVRQNGFIVIVRQNGFMNILLLDKMDL